jgi:hypothetical protein
VDREEGAVTPGEWSQLLHSRAPSAGLSTTPVTSARPNWLPPQAWAALDALGEAVPAFRGASTALASFDGPPPPLAALLAGGGDAYQAAGTADLAALWQAPETSQHLHQVNQRQQQQDEARHQQQHEQKETTASAGLPPFQRLLLIRALHEEALPAAFASYAAHLRMALR